MKKKNTQPACINLCTKDTSTAWQAIISWWERMKIMILQIQKYKYNTENEEYKYKKIHHVPALTSATA